ncbi:hypothetical protein FRC01_008039, partial [Tulasnella sp. 417]
MPSTARSPSSGGSLTSLDPSPPPSTGPSPKVAEASKAKARTGASDASSDLSELSSDGEKEGETGEQEEQESVEDVLTSEDDDDDEDDDGSSTDRPFVSPSSRRKPSKGKRKSKAKPVAAIRRPKTSRSKSQSPSKSSSRTKPASSKASAGQPHTSRHTRRESDSFSSASHSGAAAAPMSATSSYGVTNSVGDSDEEDTGRRSSRSRKRTSIVPGQMWEWALPKAPKAKKGKSQANAGSESNHGSPVREPSSPSREPEGASTAPASVDQDEKSAVSAASFEGTANADEEEDIKPDIATLQSNPAIPSKAPDIAAQINAVPESNRTSPGLPLADFTKGSRRSFSASSIKKGANSVGEDAPANADAMD